MSRGGLKINLYSKEERENESKEQLSPLLSQFAKAVIPQTAADQARSRNAQSFMQQLTSLMTNKPRYATVDDAVKDMQERTGLNKYLENIKSANNTDKKKEASTQIPSSLMKYDFANDIVNYIRNNIKTIGVLGVSIPSLQYDLLSVFPKLNATDVMNEDVAKFINDCIYSEQSQLSPEVNNQNIGRGVGLDLQENNDPWASLIPSK